MKQRICKCGHLKEEHYKQPRTKLSIITECQKCKCCDYMDRKQTGKINSIYGICLSGLAILFIVTTGIPAYFITEEVKIPVSVLGIILIALMILLILQVLPNLTLAYFDYKRRKEYPIESNEQPTNREVKS